MGKRETHSNAPEQQALILRRPSHMVVRVVRHLKDMRRHRLLVLRGIAVLCCIFLHDRVGVGWDIFVGVEGDEGRGTDSRVHIVVHEPFSKACNDNVVGNGRQFGEVCHRLQALVDGGLAIHRRHGGKATASRTSVGR